ncbi:MAG: phosphoribosylformylglycinamidine synthase subunit PurQ [bacterium]
MGAPRQQPRRNLRLGKQIVWFYRIEPDGRESAFGVETSGQMLPNDIAAFANGFREAFEYLPSHEVTGIPCLDDNSVVIVGPRLDFPDTPLSSAAVQIAHQIGFEQVTRIEQFHHYPIPTGMSRENFIKTLKYDDRVERIHEALPMAYQIRRRPPRIKFIKIDGENGRRNLVRFCKRNSLGFREEQINAIMTIFLAYGKNPTNLALFNMSQMWSDHCWHILFMLTKFVIDGVLVEGYLIDSLKAPYDTLKGTAADNTEIVLNDNASAVRGARVRQLQPKYPGKPSKLIVVDVILHLLFSAETHNYPSQVGPYQGRTTELGGEIRDQLGAGRGSDITHAACLTILGSLRFANGYRIPGEIIRGQDYSLPEGKASPIQILVEGTKGWVDYANAFGKPLTIFEMYSGAIWRMVRKAGKVVKERIESLKPVCYGLGAGNIRNEHKRKRKPKKGWLIVRIGGGARDVGFCGGSGSSSSTGTNTAQFDKNAVQRGNPIEERAFYEVVKVCCQMGLRSFIQTIHDQGAGGLGNMTNELIGFAGGRVFLRSVTVDDPAMGDVKVYVAEWQESQGLLIHPDDADAFLGICARENCNVDIIGYITGDGMLKVFHEKNDEEVKEKKSQAIFEILMKDLLSKAGEFEIEDETPEIIGLPIAIEDRGMYHALSRVLRRSEVASVEWFLRLVDQTVGGYVVKGPYCGAYNTPISNFSIIALSNHPSCKTGQATAIGTAPFATCLDVVGGVGLSVGRLLTRLQLAGVDSTEKVKVLCNWMWPANIKPPDGEVALLYQATQAVRDFLIKLAMAIIGGKDSSSMATWVNDLLVKSIETVVFSSSCLVDNYNDHLTADIRQPGRSSLIHIDFARGERRLGGSSFALAHGQLGDESPQLDDPVLVRRSFPVIKSLIDQGLVVSGLEIGQGGLAATITKMCIAGGCGAHVEIESDHSYQKEYFAEELGLVLECPDDNLLEAGNTLENADIPFNLLGTTDTIDSVKFGHNGESVMSRDTGQLRQDWEMTSFQIRRLLVDKDEAGKERRNTRVRREPLHRITAAPLVLPNPRARHKPKALCLRYRGTNGHVELEEAFKYVGFNVREAHFNDFLLGQETLDDVQVFLGPGGWSDNDALGSAVGMYLRATRNPIVKSVFERFLARDDTLSVGFCNHAQWSLRMGIAPLPELAGSRARPLFTQIGLGRFNHQWVTVKVEDSPCVFTKSLIGSILPIVVANGEGKFNASAEVEQEVRDRNLVVFSYVDHLGRHSKALPYSPSGSDIGAVTDPTGRHLASMPHMERLMYNSRYQYVSQEMNEYEAECGLDVDWSALINMVVDPYKWCMEHR